MYKIGNMPKSLELGYIGENLFRTIEIDMSAWVEKLPGGVPSIIHIQPGKTEADAYIADTSFDTETNVLSWTITDADLGLMDSDNNGEGEIQVWMEEETDDDSVTRRGKSIHIASIIHKSATEPDDEPPAAQTGWMEAMTALKTATVSAAEDAEDAKDDAVAAKEAAEDAQEDAETAQAAAETAQAAAETAMTKYPKVESDGYWYVWNPSTGEYQNTNVKAQGPQGDPGAVQDVQIDGTSILGAGGVANIPTAGTNKYGAIRAATSASDTKAGNSNSKAVVTNHQHESAFYGFARAAGADMSGSSNPVGQYTDAALVAIQKMLGIYEAPWELIREDTVTNATEADIEITVDGDGNAFELTDLILLFETPKQNNASGKSDYGIVKYYYGNSILAMVSSAWTQNANAAANGISSIVENKNGLIIADIQQYTASGGSGNVRRGYKEGLTGTQQSIQIIQDFAVSKVNITKVTGTGHYKLYGKRKWN